MNLHDLNTADFRFPDLSSLTFVHPWWLLLLLLLPVIALLEGGKGAAPAVIYSSLKPVLSLGRVRRSRIGGWLTSLLLFALALLIVAFARPRLNKSYSQVKASGIDIMLALDVSGSMQAEDYKVAGQQTSRVDVVKMVTKKFIDARPNDRIGMMAFAGRPYLVSPLTLDHDWLIQNLERITVGDRGILLGGSSIEDGTAIGSAIASCTNRLIQRKDTKSRIIVLLTDGANNLGKVSPLTAADAAKALGVKVYTIAAGVDGFAPFPVHDAFGRKFYQPLKADVDVDTLKKIAATTDAKFYRATDTQKLNQIFDEIDQLEKSTVETKRYNQYQELFPWLLSAGFALLSLQALLAQTIGNRLP
jgi:Ca-activated chloride channel family protein